MHPEMSDCNALLEASHLNVYRENTFRITGLSVDASEREIKKQAAKLKMLEELGQGEDGATHAYAIRPAPSVDQIRAAMQRLKEPEHRLIDEFFWFWPKEFGKSDQDPAIQALQRGDATAAHELWSSEATDPKTGYVAIHNLAILYHLVALDWTAVDLTSAVDSDREAKIEQYWRTAFHHWEQLATHDGIWDMLKARVQALDDPRLTTGFVRRMRASLPEALDKINAEAALKFAESERMDWARKHIDFMKETHQGLDDVEKTALLVLTPTRKRVKQLVQSAKDDVQNNPSCGIDTARALISHCHPLLSLFELFHGQVSHHQTELFDEVASQINICVVQHGISTGLTAENIDLLEDALEFATADHLRELISKNIATRQGNLRFKRVEPFCKKLDAIEASTVSASQRLALVHSEIVPAIDSLRETDEGSEAADELAKATAVALRGISIYAHNEEEDFDTAISAMQLAIALTNNSEFIAQLRKDEQLIQENLKICQEDRVLLYIRNDRIEITHTHFTHNNTTLLLNQVSAFSLEASKSFGVFSNEIKYDVHLYPDSGWPLTIQCKRMLRSEAQARNDYQKIAGGLVRFLLPKLVRKALKAIQEGKTVTIGSARLNKEGIKLFPRGLVTTEALLTQRFITPWPKTFVHIHNSSVVVMDQVAANFRNTPEAAARQLIGRKALERGNAICLDFSVKNALVLGDVAIKMKGAS